MTQDGLALQQFSEVLKDDVEIAFAAVSQVDRALCFASDELKMTEIYLGRLGTGRPKIDWIDFKEKGQRD